MGRSGAMVLWKTKRTKARKRVVEEKGLDKEGADRRNYEIPRRVRNREQGSENKVYPSGRSNTPTTAPSAPQLPASASARHLRDTDKRLIPATSLETTR